jgi:hypothetical protein
MTRNELEILRRVGQRWSDAIGKLINPACDFAFTAQIIISDYNDVLNELEKGIPEES